MCQRQQHFLLHNIKINIIPTIEINILKGVNKLPNPIQNCHSIQHLTINACIKKLLIKLQNPNK